jgi:hypothetical protein
MMECICWSDVDDIFDYDGGFVLRHMNAITSHSFFLPIPMFDECVHSL